MIVPCSCVLNLLTRRYAVFRMKIALATRFQQGEPRARCKTMTADRLHLPRYPDVEVMAYRLHADWLGDLDAEPSA